MNDLLQTPRERTLFVFLCVAVIVALLAIRLWVAWETGGVGKSVWGVLSSFSVSILDNLIAALIAATATVTLFSFLSGARSTLKSVQLVEAAESNTLHMAAVRVSAKWWHNGHHGSWVRGHAMPCLAATGAARDTEVRMIILDPRNLAACDTYTQFRNRERVTSVEGPWTLDRTYGEIYATILAAQIRNCEPNRLSVQLVLRPDFSVYRYDINDSWAAITCIDPRDRPIFVTKDSPWYATLESDFRRFVEQMPKLALLSDSDLRDLGDISTPGQVISLMDSLQVPIPARVGALDSASLAEYALEHWKAGTRRYA